MTFATEQRAGPVCKEKIYDKHDPSRLKFLDESHFENWDCSRWPPAIIPVRAQSTTPESSMSFCPLLAFCPKTPALAPETHILLCEHFISVCVGLYAVATYISWHTTAAHK
eukprot:g35206.t1